jgi:thiamine kinase-like enzyme
MTAAGGVVAKLPDDSAELSLDARSQFEILGEVSSRGLGPRPLGFDEETGILLVDYWGAAAHWTESAARDRANIARIASALRALHEIRPSLRTFRPRRFVQSYVAENPLLSSARGQRLAEELSRLAESLPEPVEPHVLCHNDLVASNVLDDGRLGLIDFEYAVAAEPIVDLSSLAAMNDYSLAQRSQLLEHYYGNRKRPHSDETFAKFVRFHKLVAHFWQIRTRARQVG